MPEAKPHVSRDVRTYISFLREHDRLTTIAGADRDLEIGGLSELAQMRARSSDFPPALLFDDVPGFPGGHRILTNAFDLTPFQASTASGFETTTDMRELLVSHKERSIAAEGDLIPPTTVETGPVEENVLEGDAVDVTAFPAPWWHENDGGRYIGTADIVVTRNAETGRINAATYRVQVHGPDSVTVYMSPGKDGLINRRSYLDRGEPAPFVIVVGVPPVIFTGANERISSHVNELEYVGGRLGEPVEVVEGEVTGLPIPARAEIVLEGFAYPDAEEVTEGPFGEWTGYYAGGERRQEPVSVERIYHRDDPILTGIHLTYPDGRAQAGTVMKSVGRIWADLERTGIPGIKAVNGMMPNSWLTVVAVDTQYQGHSKQVGLDVFSSPTGAYHGRFVLVVDDDIDVYDWGEVLWAMCSRVDPEDDIQVVDDCWSTPLDPVIPPHRRERGDFSNSRAIIDATRPYHWRDEFPETTKMTDELRDTLLSEWRDELFGPMATTD